MTKHVFHAFDNSTSDIILQDKNLQISKATSQDKLQTIGIGSMTLYVDKIVINFGSKIPDIVLNLADLLTINPQVHERIEMFYKNGRYRAVGMRPGVSGLKWEIAVNAIWYKMGLLQKLSPYIKVLRQEK